MTDTNPTPEQMTRWLTAQMVHATKITEQFTDEFTANPAEALSWSHKVFTAAAILKLYPDYVESLYSLAERPRADPVAYVVKKATALVQRNAYAPASSTSAVSNLVSQAEAEAAATILDAIEWGKIG
jgi:hypothetical protein|tara:strand:- start:334 stop:714 length:381 start_codon:yes stop_codon:yes gene_type:complete